MPFDGMNVDSIRKVGEDLKKQATALETVRGQVDRLVNSSQQNWGGKDARDFAGWWRNQHRPHLEQLRQLLDGLGTSAKNNANEQERASGTSSGATGGQAGAGPAATQPPANTPVVSMGTPDATARAQAASSFVDRWNGQRIDADGSYGAQCFDVFEKYSMEKLGTPYLVTGSDKASDLYARYDVNGVAAYYDRIPAGGTPESGDIVVWGGGTYGHVALVTQADAAGFKVLEQNYVAPYDGAVPAAVHDKSYTGGSPILGYLRPKAGLLQ